MSKKLLFAAFLACTFAACQNTQPSSVTHNQEDSLTAKLERNKTVVLNAQRAFASQNIEEAFKDCAPDFKEYGSGGTPVSNLDSVKMLYKMFTDALDIKGEGLAAIPTGDSVIVIGTWSGTFRKPLMGIQPNGKSFKYDDVDIFVLNNDGKIVSHRAIQQEAAMLRQLGLLEPVKH